MAVQEKYDAIVAGHICLDIIPAIRTEGFSFTPGRLLEVDAAVLGTGGAVSNTGLALHKLGIPTRLMGKVGADSFGRCICEIVAGHGRELTEGMIETPGEVSSYTVVLSPPGMDRMFLHCPGCNDTFGADDILYGMLPGAQLFHFGYPPLMKHVVEEGGAELIRMFRQAKETGITTSLDMSMPDPKSFPGQVDWPQILSAALPYVDIYMPSLEETLFMMYQERFREISEGGGNPDAVVTPDLLSSIGAELLSMGPAIVGLKMGTMGLYLRTAEETGWAKTGRATPRNIAPWTARELWSPCFQTNAVGTTGAGDTTIAGFLAGLLRGHSAEECATLACAVGACNVEAADALGGLRNWDETWARVQAGWPRRPLEQDMAGWSLCPGSQVWRGPADCSLSFIPATD